MKIINCPTSQGSFGANQGCEKAPQLISPESKTLALPSDNIEETNKILKEAEGDLFIGGDHSITYSLFKGFKKNNPEKKIGLLILDAHADMSDNFHPPTHEDFNRVLLEEGTLSPEDLLIIGCTKIYDNEKEFAEGKSIQIMEHEKIDLNKVKEFIEKHDLIYLSIDIDCLRKADAPGTGYPDGKLSMNELINFLKTFVSEKFKRMDLVEANPDKDVDGITIKSAKRIVETLKSKKDI